MGGVVVKLLYCTQFIGVCADRLHTMPGSSRNSDDNEIMDVFSNYSSENDLLSPDINSNDSACDTEV
jgi:hypothetical protein